MEKLIKKIKRGGLAKNIVLVASGTFVAQVINTIITPLITRLYPAKIYGVLSVYNSTVSILVIASSLAFQKSIPIIKDDHKAKMMVENCIGVLTAYSTIVLALCLLLSKDIYGLLGIADIYKYRLIIPLGVFVVGGYEVLLQWIYRRQAYEVIPKTRMMQAIAGGAVKLVGGLLYPSAFALLAGAIVNQSAGLSSFIKLIHMDLKDDKERDSVKEHFKILNRYNKFFIYSLPADFISTFSAQIPVLVLSSLYGSAISGYYGLAYSIVNLPISLIIVSISRVLYAECAKIGKQNPCELKRLCLKISKTIIAIIIIPTIICIIWGPQLFSFVFGEEWSVSGEFARIMMGMIASYCVVLPVGRLYEILEKQNYDFAINLIRIIAILMAIIVLYNTNSNYYVAVGLISSINMVAYICMFIGVFICINKQMVFVERKK